MTPLTFHILAALALRDATASQLLNQMYKDVQGQLLINPRSFYAALNRLKLEGKIEHDRVYHLTLHGRRLLKAEQAHLLHSARILGERLP